MTLNIMENDMTPKAEKSPTTTRRQILVAAPAALVAGSGPAIARAPDVSQELLALVEHLKTVCAERKRATDAYDAGDKTIPCDELMDAEIEAEAAIMRFPARTFDEVMIVARLAWSQMTADPDEPHPFDDFVLYLVPAILRLDKQTDQASLDKWLSDLADERREV
jgi:hypothetical protein